MSWNNSSANLVTCDMGWHNHPVKAVAVTDRTTTRWKVRWKDRQRDRWKDCQILFHKTLPATTRGPKILRKDKYWHNQFWEALYIRQILLKKILRKDKHWHNQLRKTFSNWQELLKKMLRKDKYWHNQLRKTF